MERAIKGLVTGRYEWIGFTSVNAVRAVREKFEDSDWTPAHSQGCESLPWVGSPPAPCVNGSGA